MNYDEYISTNPAEKEQERAEKDYSLWIAKQDNLEELAGNIGWDAQDILSFVSTYKNDYEIALEDFVENYKQELFEYFIEVGE